MDHFIQQLEELENLFPSHRHLIILNDGYKSHITLIPKGQMVFLSFDHGPIFWIYNQFFSIFRNGVPHGDLFGYVIYLSKLHVDLEI